jgi:hypothetical protein
MRKTKPVKPTKGLVDDNRLTNCNTAYNCQCCENLRSCMLNDMTLSLKEIVEAFKDYDMQHIFLCPRLVIDKSGDHFAYIAINRLETDEEFATSMKQYKADLKKYNSNKSKKLGRD